MGSGGLNNGDSVRYRIDERPLGNARHLRIICIGAGVAGLNFARQLDKHLRNVDFQIYEKNSQVGGTWLENRYPGMIVPSQRTVSQATDFEGVACDIPSHIYQYSWEPNPDWSEFYASGDEILEYLSRVAREHQLERFIAFQHRVVKAAWQEEAGLWQLQVEDIATGEIINDECHFLINAGGYLNNWRWPDVPALKSFKGTLVHSAAWPADLDVSGKRVAVIGNGSSGIQIVPQLQPRASSLIACARNPTWVTAGFAQKFAGPNGINYKYSKDQKASFREQPQEYLAYRKSIEKELAARTPMLHKDSPEQAAAVEFSRNEMRRRLGPDSPLFDKLVPEFGVACRRPTPGTGYLEALTAANVRVITDEITEVCSEGIKFADGQYISVDVIICATGFDVSYRPRFPIIGRREVDLRECWKTRPTSYLALAAANIPNFFMFQGPNSPVGHGSAMQIIEHSTRYMLKMIFKAQTEAYKAFEPQVEAIEDFVEHADEFMKRMIWSGRCKSWFKNGTLDGPVSLHPGSRVHWFHALSNPRYEDWVWTTLRPNRFAYFGNGYSTWEKDPDADATWYLNDAEVGYESLAY